MRRKLEDACWRRSHAPARKPNPKLNQRPLRALLCPKLDNFCCYAVYSNVVVKLVQECKFLKTHFTSVLQKQFAANDTFLREANGYKRALALRNARQHLSNYSRNTSLRLVETMSRDRFNKQMLPVMHDLADHQYLNYFAMTTY